MPCKRVSVPELGVCQAEAPFRCKAFEAKGCIVYATSRRLETMQGLESEHIHLLQMDVANDDHVDDVVSKIVEERGRIDVLVNNAGTVAGGKLTKARSIGEQSLTHPKAR